MKIYLAQHGKCLPENIDPERSLSEEGKQETRKIAEILASHHIRVHLIVHSGKTRARQTAEIFGEYLKPDQGLIQRPGLNPNDQVTEFSKNIREEKILYVGHLPFMEKLVSYLTTGSEDQKIFQFQNSGIVCLEKEPEQKYFFMRWGLIPALD